MSSLLLTDALLYDGSGNPPRRADVLIQDEKILQVEPAGTVVFPGVPSRNLNGLSLSPGWVDVHAHSDASLLAAPEAFGKISQGITTEISGNCGLSAFPIQTEEVREHLRVLYAAYDIALNWDDFHSYAEALTRRQPALNAVFLCGHNTLRANVSGYQPHKLSPRQLEEMNILLRDMLAQGAAGLSTGLLYTPGCFSDEAELLSLLRTVSAQNGIYATRLRNEGDRLEEAVTEAVKLAETAGTPLHISHLKTALPRNWHKLEPVLNQIYAAQRRGLAITADRYPYCYAQSSLSLVLGAPYDTMTDRAIQEILQRDPKACEQAKQQLETSGRDWTRVILCKSGATSAAGLSGWTVAEAANRCGTTPAELVIRILQEDAPGSMAAFGGMSENNLNRILTQQWVCCGTDETARPQNGSLGLSHPRGFGSFPRFIQQLRQQGIPMAEIIRKITSLPARIFKLTNRGLIRSGMWADLVVFDEQKLNSTADFRHPHIPSDGILQVYVNGVPAYDGETRQVTARTGKILRYGQSFLL